MRAKKLPTNNSDFDLVACALLRCLLSLSIAHALFIGRAEHDTVNRICHFLIIFMRARPNSCRNSDNIYLYTRPWAAQQKINATSSTRVKGIKYIMLAYKRAQACTQRSNHSRAWQRSSRASSIRARHMFKH